MEWNPERILFYRGDMSQGAPPALPGKRVAVGIWDLNTSAGPLPRLLNIVEQKQSYFSFFSVEAPFQTGLTIPGPYVAQEWLHVTGEKMSAEDAAVNVSARQLFDAATPLLGPLQVDWLVVVVKSMISDTTLVEDCWHNLFTTSRGGRVILVSSFGLRDYAAQGGRPFESVVLGTALSALLAAMVPEIQYNREKSTGSIFDFCENRSDIVKSIRNPHIDAQNRQKIPPQILEPAEQILQILKSYKGAATPTQLKRQLTVLRRKRRLAKRPKSKAKIERTGPLDVAAPAVAFKEALTALDVLRRKLRTRPAKTPKKKGIRANLSSGETAGSPRRDKRGQTTRRLTPKHK